MKDVIETNKYVELTYEVIDQKSGQVLTSVEFPLGYVHGVNEILVYGDKITASVAKLNEYYLASSSEARKQYTMCHGTYDL